MCIPSSFSVRFQDLIGKKNEATGIEQDQNTGTVESKEYSGQWIIYVMFATKLLSL